KRGDLLETLDINISDELGTRNYEMFSGGEAFRINFATLSPGLVFAVRLALGIRFQPVLNH
ncbi:unnamed protein product, partial [marine sediment metagenome]